MKPIKPKYYDTVNVQWSISKRSKEIINYYSKYTKYDESELIDLLISDILEDEAFVNWLKGRRYKTRVDKFIFGDKQQVEEMTNEENEETSDFWRY